MDPLDRLIWWGWDRVVRVPELGECWEWRGPKHKAGYGNIRTKTADGRQTFVRAHRVALESSGVSLDGLLCLHKCDNPPCVNPSHLEAGDDLENSRQKVSRNRQRPGLAMGVKNGASKIDGIVALRVREMYAGGGVKQSDIAMKFGISQSNVSKIVRNKTWRKK